MIERVLALVAHPDDETLGCGATLAKHAKDGDAVAVVCFADGVASRFTGKGTGAWIKFARERHQQFRAACKILGTENVFIHQYADNCMDNVPQLQVVRHLEIHLERFKPTIVYTHHGGDLNVDHRVMHDCVRVACRPQSGCTVKALYFFEVPCSTTWGEGFNPTYFIDARETLETKLEAARCYKDELKEPPHPRSIEGIRHIAAVRGNKVHMDYAEAFAVGRITA